MLSAPELTTRQAPCAPHEYGTPRGTVLSAEEWRRRAGAHRERLDRWVRPHLYRHERGNAHPVYDFLFDYYSYRPAHLCRWSPGADVVLEECLPADLGWERGFSKRGSGIVLESSSFPRHRINYLNWATVYLRETGARTPRFGCFGLHEWAMVYRAPEVRHSAVPLRLSAAEIAAVVDELPVVCSHFDAFRFFTPEARPLNRLQPTRATVEQADQPGCIHVTMDLYRFAYKLGPYVEAELLADTFCQAVTAREIDMRASPYDLRELGFAPIPIETAAGREEYAELQRKLHLDAAPLRSRLLRTYTDLLSACG